MGRAKIECIQDVYRSAFTQTIAVADGFPADLRLKQFKPGKSHALWLLGHLTLSLDLVVNQWIIGGPSTIPAEYMAKFAPNTLGGGPVSPDAKFYPAWDDVLATYKHTGASTIELMSSLTDGDLLGELRAIPENARGFFGKFGPALIGMGLHDAHHRGQMLMLKGAVG